MTGIYNVKKNTMRKNILSKAVFAAILMLSSMQAGAVPALPRPIVVTQPDGRTVTVCLKGDERVHWAETTDGYTLLQDDKGFWTFATIGKNGNLTASDLRYEGTSAIAKAKGIKPRLTYSAQQVRKVKKKVAQPNLLIDGTFPSTGKRKLLMLLVNYSDTKPKYTREAFEQQMNQEGYGGVGSFRDYYLEQSCGKLDIDVTVTDWITLPKAKGTYGTDGAAYMIYDALSQLSSTLDLSEFDNDGDGILDGLAVIHQGTGQEASGDASDIWSHSSVIYGQTFNGIAVRRYTIEPEILATTGRMSTIGVVCHEFGHALGAPDFYDTDYASSGGEFCGTGIWDLLGSGAWGGDYGTRPTGINAWQKWVWGWIEPETLNDSKTVTGMPSADSKPVAYRMETGTPGEYYIMENRQRTSPFDYALPGHGLVVYHVNENIIREKLASNDINATYPQGLYTVCSDAGVDPDKQSASFGDVDSGACPFPGTYGHTGFSDDTSPSAKSIDGRCSYRELRNITDVDGLVGFEFVHRDEPPKPEALKAVAQKGNVELSWQMPEGSDAKCFNVYRNDVKIAQTTALEYTDESPESGDMITYLVDVEYEDGRISHPVSTQIRVPVNKLTGLQASANGNDVSLRWTVDNTLTRVDIYNGQVASVDVYGDKLEYANCFTPADLSTYVGAKVTRLEFLPMQGPADMSVNLHVWEGDANGENMQLVSERSVKEFANGQPRDLKLTTPVVIKADHTYWFAVECTSTNGVVTLAYDQSNLLPERGNCVLENGKFVESAQAKGNLYVSATVEMPKDEAMNDLDMTWAPDYDASCDLFFPLAYSVYCDGELVGLTTAHCRTLNDVPLGEHEFVVASYYKGNNESVGMSKSVVVDGTTGVAATVSGTATVVGGKGVITFDGCHGRATICSASGAERNVRLEGAHVSIGAEPGVYAVKVEGSVHKVIVRQ